MTTTPRRRRSLVGAMLATTMCSGLLTGSASAGGPPTPHGPPTDVIAHRMMRTEAATVGDTLTEPSRVRSAARGDTMAWPVEGRLTSAFGTRYGRMHRGIDVAAPTGTAIRAAQDGTVTFAGWKGGYGRTVDIAHDGGQTSRSAHQSELLVRNGDRVERGEVIGRVGTTGSSTGPHLHFEVSVDGADLDPSAMLPAPG